MFKPGDKVRCIKESHILTDPDRPEDHFGTVGTVYEVVSCQFSLGEMVVEITGGDLNRNKTCFANRFELLTTKSRRFF